MTGLPAARKTDGVKHKGAGGNILEGSTNVFIGPGRLPAARVGDKVQHGDGVCTITEGSSVVRISGLPAARITDSVSCGGVITGGYGRVRIGRARGKVVGNVQAGMKMCQAAIKGRNLNTPNRLSRNLISTQQSYNNCGIESARQIINQATGKNISEDDLLGYAFVMDDADRGKSFWERLVTPKESLLAPNFEDGSSTANQRQSLLTSYSVPSMIEQDNLENIGQALASGQGVIADVDARVLWKGVIKDNYLQSKQPLFHSVTITGLEYDGNGKVTNVIINDTGTGQCSRPVPVNQWNEAVQAVKKANFATVINVTKNPIF